MLLYTWLLNSMVPLIAVMVNGIQNVKDIWAKLRRIYAGAENNMKALQIEREIEAIVYEAVPSAWFNRFRRL
jgi:hypothetical protein